MNDVTIIIIGMTGDLAKRKLLPALYGLVKGRVLEQFIIVGASPEKVECGKILEDVKKFIPQVDINGWQEFCNHCFYHSVEANNLKTFEQLTKFVEEKEKEHKLSSNRVLYCAVASEFYCPITQNCFEAGLLKRIDPHDLPWTRIVYEKPFGHDLASAHELNRCIGNLLHEEQIYRVDHYLTREMVSNIALVRFANCVFEPLWNNNHIASIDIILDESIGIEGRGSSYDKTGALSDIIQSHLTALLSLVAMEAPDCLSGECIRQNRARVLKDVCVVDALLGQYDGYLQEPGVEADSTTETFAAVVLNINNRRWKGVPFYLRTGKCLHQKNSAIHIRFKKTDCPLIKQCKCESNSLTIQLTPRPAFSLRLNAKKPGIEFEFMPIDMEYCHNCIFKERVAQEYEILFEEVIRGIHSVSVRFDEIESAWKIIDCIKSLKKEVYVYEKGSTGPKELTLFEQTQGIKE